MRRAAAMLLVLAACTKAPPPRTKVVLERAPKTNKDPLSGPKRLLEDAYKALEEGDADAIDRLLTDDVLAFGLGPSDTFNKKDGLTELVRQELLPIGLRGQKLRFSESRIVGVLAPGKRSAILYDLPRMEVEKGAKTVVWLPRITAHAVLQETWKLDAVHVSIGTPEARLYEPGAQRAFLPPGDVTPEVKGESDQLVGLTKRLLADMKVRLDRLSDAEEAVQLGTAPADVYEGGAPFKALVRPLLKQIKKSGQTQEVLGNFRARLAPGGKTGWVAAHVVMKVGKGRKQVVLPTFRGLWIYAEENGVWNLMSEHLSLALKASQRDSASDETLAARRAAREAREAKERAAAEAAAADAGVADAPPEKKDSGEMEAW